MKFTKDQLKTIYDRTTGYCHICGKKLAFKNYADFNARASWEVEHSNPQANGGTHHLNNLYAACISCNRSKGKTSTKTVRIRNGRTSAPLSVPKRKEAKASNAFVGGATGALIGGRIAGLPGAAVGALVGAVFGHNRNPDK